MTTALQIIDRAYLYLGYKDANEPLNASDSQYALAVLNDLIDSWNGSNLYQYSIQDVVAVVSGSPITIGPGQTINTARPVSIPDGVFFRINGLDFPVTQIDRQRFADIPLKDIATQIPWAMYYDPGQDFGSLYFYPQPRPGSELHLPIRQQLTPFANLADDRSLPPGYVRALQMTLAEELSPGIKTISDSFAKKAAAARRTIRRTNAEDVTQDASGIGGTGSYIANFIAGNI